MDEIADALLGAEEILEVMTTRGTRGVEQECDAGRIANVYRKVLTAKRQLSERPIIGQLSQEER